MMARTNFVLCFLTDMILEVVLKVEILAIHADIHPTVAGFFFNTCWHLKLLQLSVQFID